jgi:hypothetical protein
MTQEALRMALEALGNSWTEPCTDQYNLEATAMEGTHEPMSIMRR